MTKLEAADILIQHKGICSTVSCTDCPLYIAPHNICISGAKTRLLGGNPDDLALTYAIAYKEDPDLFLLDALL